MILIWLLRLKELNGLIRYFASWFKGRYWERANEKPPGVGKGAFLANQFTMPPCLVIELGLLVIGNVPMDLEIFPIRALPIKADKTEVICCFNQYWNNR
jgi:hypothetical protein